MSTTGKYLKDILAAFTGGLVASEAHIGEVGGRVASPSPSSVLTLPASIVTYTANYLMANSATAKDVLLPSITLGRLSSGVGATGLARRFRLRKSSNVLTNASFSLLFWNSNPVKVGTVTMTSANPGVVTWTSNAPATGAPVVFTTTGGLPTGVVSGTIYYAINIDANTFWLSDTLVHALAGTNKVDTTAGAQSGVHTGNAGILVGDNADTGIGTSGGGKLAGSSRYVGAVDITCDRSFADGASGNGVPNIGSEFSHAVQSYYWGLIPRAAYTRIAGEVFTLEVEDWQN